MPTRRNGSKRSPTTPPCAFFIVQFSRRLLRAKASTLARAVASASFVAAATLFRPVTRSCLAVSRGPPKRSVNSSSAASPSVRTACSTLATVSRTCGCASAWRFSAASAVEKSASEWRRIRMAGAAFYFPAPHFAKAESCPPDALIPVRNAPARGPLPDSTRQSRRGRRARCQSRARRNTPRRPCCARRCGR